MTAMGNLPEVVSREEWLAARRELLAKEKELARARDRINDDRRRSRRCCSTSWEEPKGRAVPLGLHVGGPAMRLPDEYDT